jgi:hypothetical protein
VDRDAPFGQFGGHHIGGAHFFKTQLRVGMDVPANGRNAGGVGQDGFIEFHEDSLAGDREACQRGQKCRGRVLDWGFHGAGGMLGAGMRACTMGRMSVLSLVRGLPVGVCVLLLGSEPAGATAHPVQLRCDLTYAGATQEVVAEPVQDVYAAPSVDVRGRFRFKAVLVGAGEQIERIHLYVYMGTAKQAVMVQQAAYQPPFLWPGDGAPLSLTGQQHVYAGPMERELIYSCKLHRGQP